MKTMNLTVKEYIELRTDKKLNVKDVYKMIKNGDLKAHKGKRNIWIIEYALPDYISVKDYSKFHHIGVKAVYELIHNNELKAFKDPKMHNGYMIDLREESNIITGNDKDTPEVTNTIDDINIPKLSTNIVTDDKYTGDDKDTPEVTNVIDDVKNTKLLPNTVVVDGKYSVVLDTDGKYNVVLNDQSKNGLAADNTNSVSTTVSTDDNLNNDSEENGMYSIEDSFEKIKDACYTCYDAIKQKVINPLKDCEENVVSNEDDYCEDDYEDDDYGDDDYEDDDYEENILANEYIDKKIYTFKQEFYSYLKSIGKDLELWRNLFKHDKIFELRQLLYKDNTMVTVCDDNLDLYFLLNDKENEKKVIKIIDYCIDNKKDARKVILATVNYFNMYSNTISIGDFSDINIINNSINSNDVEDAERFELLYNLNVFLGLHFYYTVDELMNILLKDNEFTFIGFEKECSNKLNEFIKDDDKFSRDYIESVYYSLIDEEYEEEEA